MGIFLDGTLLACRSSDCFAARIPAGTEPLPQAGSLLYLVCAKLNPKPESCLNVQPASEGAAVQPTPPCENCVEVGAFRWRASKHRQPKVPQNMWVFASLAVGSVAVA